MSFQLSSGAGKDKVFLIKKSDIEGRLEPKYYTSIYLKNEERLYDANVRLTSIGQVTKLVSDGTHFTPKYQFDGVKFVSVKDVRKSEINLTNTKFISLEEADYLDKRCKPSLNDILLTKIGTYGLASVVKTHERFQLFVSVALLRTNEEVTPEYLEVYLNSQLAYLQFNRIIKGAGVPDLHLEDIRKIKILVPDKSKQIKIADYYFRKYEEKKQKEALAKQLLNSIDDYLLDELGIELPKQEKNTLESRIFIRQLSEISEGRIDPFFHSLNNKDITGKYSFYKLRSIANIKKGESITSDKIAMGEIPVIAGGQTSPYFHNIANCEAGVITVSASGAYSGYVWYHEKPIFASDCSVISSKSKSDLKNKYLFEYLKARQQSIYNLQQGSGQPHVYPSDLGKIAIPVPPIEKQLEIIEYISKIRQQAQQLQQEAKADLKQAKKEVEAMILGEA